MELKERKNILIGLYVMLSSMRRGFFPRPSKLRHILQILMFNITWPMSSRVLSTPVNGVFL